MLRHLLAPLALALLAALPGRAAIAQDALYAGLAAHPLDAGLVPVCLLYTSDAADE